MQNFTLISSTPERNTYRRGFLALFFERMVQQALDLQHLGCPEEGVEPVLLHLDLSLVHEVQEQAKIDFSDVSEYHYRVLTRVALENIVIVREQERWRRMRP